ncbi:DUF3379 domain-containing protein [Pleionea sediminis]|uniref:DUF3379 domain-containing protein n=1 Tax=Pleionea sediminis TaxID=2569479 RepID=UPI0011858755|nr:DUF3379 domain-containing protein [Pleionea sediminis]
MNCTEFHQQLEFCEKGSVNSLSKAQAEHMRECELCEAYWQKHVVCGFLHAVSSVDAPAGLEARILAKASQKVSENSSQSRKVSWLAGAVAASLVLFSSVWLIDLFRPESPASEQMAQVKVSLPINQVSILPVMIESPSALPQVTISVNLGPSLSIEHYNGLRKLSWQAALNEGANIINLPVLVASEKGDKVIVTVESGDEMKTYEFLVEGQKNSSKNVNSINDSTI